MLLYSSLDFVVKFGLDASVHEIIVLDFLSRPNEMTTVWGNIIETSPFQVLLLSPDLKQRFPFCTVLSNVL